MTNPRNTMLYASVLAALRVLDVGRRRLDQLAAVVEAAALAGLTDELLQKLTITVYDSKGAYKDESPLFDWEKRWFTDDLPKAPARLLVGGAGSGREVFPLSDNGYTTLAFDPALHFVSQANRRLGGREGIEFVQGSYEDLAAGNSAPLQEALQRWQPFDAVLLGWGSFTHVVDEHARVAVLTMVKSLCPRGPVLLSYWSRPETTGVSAIGRTAKLGACIGKAIAGKKVVSRSPGQGDNIVSHAGFCHSFSGIELQELAARAGYSIRLPETARCGTNYPHATLLPNG